jgi:ABC-type antimicrobial peptide transport system permease subunit
MDDATDADLILAACDGDDTAFNELVQRHVQSVYTFCLRYTGSKEDAQDAAQEAFVKAWRNLKKFDTKKSFRTWLFTIAKNSATGLLTAVVSMSSILLAFGVSAAIGVIFGWYPARRAAKMSPIDALRFE